MKSKEINTKLTLLFPEIKKEYIEETFWQEKDETGSHIVYEDVFVPFIKQQMLENNEKTLVRIFEFVEELASSGDSYASEVVALSVIEPLIFDVAFDTDLFLKYAKPNTLKIAKMLLSEQG